MVGVDEDRPDVCRLHHRELFLGRVSDLHQKRPSAFRELARLVRHAQGDKVSALGGIHIRAFGVGPDPYLARAAEKGEVAQVCLGGKEEVGFPVLHLGVDHRVLGIVASDGA